MKQDVFPVGQGARKRRSQWLAFGIFKLLSYSIVLILFAILGFIIYKGIGVISWEFLTTAPSDGMTGGGIWPAIVGTFYLMAGSALFAFPVGVMSGIYMNEYAPKGKLVRFIRMMTNNLSGIPSIVFGLFGMALFVKYMGFGDSILAGSLTLGLLCVPLVIRTTEEALKAIPDSFREGRNIRALEAATGVEIVVDDTPEAIVLSAFDPVRREIARLALHQLVTDGRIHPARIEEVVAKVRKQVEEEIIETGKRTTIDLGIHGLHPELIRIIGKMKYRSSYGQNLLQHARETANLCAVMASELGLNPKKAKRAGLLHDIGKVPDEEPELPHALLGMKIAEKYKEKPDICNAIGAHHDETEMTSLLAPIVQVCDAISGARPGARREIVEAYIKRLNDLEQLAMSYPGVTKTYAIQAGRELRVIVGADKIDDKQTESLSGEIAKKIQDEMTYPGQVKITVIRETRAVSFAK